MRQLTLLILSLFVCLTVSAHSAASADKLFQARKYQEATEAYHSLLRSAPKNPLYLYRYARCLQETGQTEQAIVYFERAGQKYALRDFYLGELYMLTYRFTDAIVAYQAYLPRIDDEDIKSQVNSKIETCKRAERLMKRVSDICVVDSLTMREEAVLAFYQMAKECGTLTYEEGSFIYTNERQDRQLTTLTDNTHSFVASCQRLMETWDCDTLPPIINSPSANTITPFFMLDGITMYFASDAQDGMGGYDIYLTRLNPSTNTWYEPENIGFPFNSPANDYLFAIDEINHYGYFLTDRYSPEGYVTAYKFIYDENHKNLNTDDETLRSRAQLLSWRQLTSQASPEQEETNEPSEPIIVLSEEKSREPLFIINDSVIYYSIEEFQSPKSRSAYESLLELEQSIKEKEESLSQLRLNYDNLLQRYEELLQSNEKQSVDDSSFVKQHDNLVKQILEAEKVLRDLYHTQKVLVETILKYENK